MKNPGVQVQRMKGSNWRTLLIWAISATAVIICGTFIRAAVGHKPAPAPMVVVTRSFSPPTTVRERIEGFIPPARSWTWAHRTIDTLFGQRKTANFDAEAFTFKGAYATRQIELDLGHPAFAIQTNGLAVWFLDAVEITLLRVRLEQEALGTSFRSRVTTTEGVAARMSAGYGILLNGATNQVGLQEDYFSRTGVSGTDLFVSILCSEVATNKPDHFEVNQPAVFIRTNADFSVRLQVPNRRGIFLVHRDSLAGKSAGLILDPLVPL